MTTRNNEEIQKLRVVKSALFKHNSTLKTQAAAHLDDVIQLLDDIIQLLEDINKEEEYINEVVD